MFEFVFLRAFIDIPRVAIHRGNNAKLCGDQAPCVHKSKSSGAPEGWWGRWRRIIGGLEDPMAAEHVSGLGGEKPIGHHHRGRGSGNSHHSLCNGVPLWASHRSFLPSHREIGPNTIRQVHLSSRVH